MYRQILKKAPVNPQILGEHLRGARLDRKMTNVQGAHILGVAYKTEYLHLTHFSEGP